MAAVALALCGPSFGAPCRIEIVDKSCGWPVPMVELETLHHVKFVSDNAGVIAFDLPELMGRETWFSINGQGYGVDKDGFGNAGVRFKPESGQTHRVEVERKIIARRLGRVTGGGLFGESQKLGAELGWRESGLLGQDSVQNAEFGGKLFWMWGDTTLPQYPLGLFGSPGAVTGPRPLAAFEPPLRLPLDYFKSAKGELKNLADMPGEGPTWVSGLVSLPDKNGKEHLVLTYSKDRGFVHIYEKGLATWDDASESFQRLKVVWRENTSAGEPAIPDGHVVKWTDDSGQRWVLFCNPFPAVRCPATFEAWQDEHVWEGLKPPKELRAAGSGEKVRPQSGSMAWNAWRKRWVAIFVQGDGKSSALGEVWYAESREPMGPWGLAVKVLSHDNYSFYNPSLHAEFTPPNSPILLFEGTCTAEFADHPPKTPRYDYNQVMYRLDLDDARLIPAHVE